MVTFARFTTEEQRIVDDIAARSVRLNIHFDTLEAQMDIAAVHARVPLRLAELRDADRFNFVHDLNGIYRHLNRQTGELEDHFLPRFAQPDREAAS